jgi:hypothetical protein
MFEKKKAMRIKLLSRIQTDPSSPFFDRELNLFQYATQLGFRRRKAGNTPTNRSYTAQIAGRAEHSSL